MALADQSFQTATWHWWIKHVKQQRGFDLQHLNEWRTGSAHASIHLQMRAETKTMSNISIKKQLFTGCENIRGQFSSMHFCFMLLQRISCVHWLTALHQKSHVVSEERMF